MTRAVNLSITEIIIYERENRKQELVFIRYWNINTSSNSLIFKIYAYLFKNWYIKYLSIVFWYIYLDTRAVQMKLLAHMFGSIVDSWQLWRNSAAAGNQVTCGQLKANNQSAPTSEKYKFHCLPNWNWWCFEQKLQRRGCHKHIMFYYALK
jgi:hypothetical protein